MDGKNRTTIVKTNIKWMNGLAVDMDNRKLYWLDAYTRIIEHSDYNGNNRKQVISESMWEVEEITIGSKLLYR